MKKLNIFLIICILLCSAFLFFNLSQNVIAVDQHIVSDSIVNGTIICNLTDSIWSTYADDVSPQGITVNDTNIWIADPSVDRVFKYDINGNYINNFSLYNDNTYPFGITTNGTYIWVINYYGATTRGAYIYDMTGTYVDFWRVDDDGCNQPRGITTNGTHIFISDVNGAVFVYNMTGTYIEYWLTDALNQNPLGITTDGDYIFIGDEVDSYIYKYNMTGTFIGIHWNVGKNGHDLVGGIGINGSYMWATEDLNDEVFKYNMPLDFNVTRSTFTNTEINEIYSFSPSINYSGNVTLNVPVSYDVNGIISVTNNTGGGTAVEVNSTEKLTNNTFWFDSTHHYVYIRTINLTASTVINWTINCSYGVNFNIIIPPYLEVGQYFHSEGFISDSDGDAISGMIAETRLLYANGTDALDINPKHNCTNGNYYCVFSTGTLLPGVYSVSIEFTDPTSGIVFKEGGTLYLSVNPGSGVYVSSELYFHFYNSNSGLGLEPEQFKIYADDDPTLITTDRIYDNRIKTYTGGTIYYRIDDYFNNTVYPLTGSYETVSITSVLQHENIPITWYDLLIKNMNNTIMYFEMTNSSRTYSLNLFPMDSVHIKALPGIYDITKYYYSAYNGSFLYSDTDQIVIASDMFYVATGYTARVHISWYNTNEGLGLPDETLKLYIDGDRQIDQTYFTDINKSLNITIKDYYNTTLYTGTHNITAQYTYLDFGLTFHSWKFCNKNDDYYMLSFLKSGGSRWYERGICPYETVEFILPSGTYRMRIYNASDVEIHNQSYSLVNSRVYVIHGTNLSEIISGQSIIRGQLLEVRDELDYALAPDIIVVSLNPPMVYSSYDTDGMAIGNGIYRICPALITIATTRVETTGNWINSTAMIPSNDTVENGTITLLDDTLQFAGAGITWCNITYTDNGTLYQNTSYLPNSLEVYGQNFSINASGNISVTRICKYNQHKKFYWTFNSYTGEHTSGIEVINPMSVPLNDIYIYVEFSNKSVPDGNTVVLRDVDNGGKLLERGINFDVTTAGIHFYLLSMEADDTREFSISYYKSFEDSYRYDEEKVSIPGYEETTWQGDSYNKLIVSWINDENTIFRGGLYIKLDFDEVSRIDFSSIRIWDEDNNIEIDSDRFVFGSDFIRIDADGIGDVNPGGMRTVSVYFLFNSFPDDEDNEFHLSTKFAEINGVPITASMIFVIIGVILSFIGFLDMIFNLADKKDLKRSKLILFVGIFITFIFTVLASMGV